MTDSIDVRPEVATEFTRLYGLRLLGGKMHYVVKETGRLVCDKLLKSYTPVNWYEDVPMCEDCAEMERTKKNALARKAARRYQLAFPIEDGDEEPAEG